MVVLQRLSSPRPPLDRALQRALTLAAQPSVRAGADFDRSGKAALANAAIERGGVEGTCAAKEFEAALRSKVRGAFCVSISVASFATRKRHLALHCALIHANKEGDYLSLALRLLRQSKHGAAPSPDDPVSSVSKPEWRRTTLLVNLPRSATM